MKIKTTVILYRNEESTWSIGTYKGGPILTMDFPTAAAARAYARSKGWNVRRAANCDA